MCPVRGSQGPYTWLLLCVTVLKFLRIFQQRVLYFNFVPDPANGRAGPASRPGWGSPGEDGLGEFIPTTVVDPGPFPHLKSGLEIHLNTDFALLQPPGRVDRKQPPPS